MKCYNCETIMLRGVMLKHGKEEKHFCFKCYRNSQRGKMLPFVTKEVRNGDSATASYVSYDDKKKKG